jgi:hypothetical protein
MRHVRGQKMEGLKRLGEAGMKHVRGQKKE